MSTLKVQVAKIDEVLPHPDPETTRLSVLAIGGYKTVTAKRDVGSDDAPQWECPYQVGDEVIYIPPDAMLTPELAGHWKVTSFLSGGARVKTVKIRGFVSRGFAAPVERINPNGFDPNAIVSPDWPLPEVGDDVSGYYGITKYEPPPPTSSDLEPEHPDFTHYTDVERIQANPNILIPGETVVVTEKIHGTNSRIASIMTEDGEIVVCGTHISQVKRGVGSKYELPLLKDDSVKSLLAGMREEYPDAASIVLHGEIFGSGVQGKMLYGCGPGEVSHRAFDISVDGNFFDWHDFAGVCEKYGVDVVPVLYEGPYDLSVLEDASDGKSTIGGNHIREGAVVHPVKERWDDSVGRVILKMVGDSYEVKQYDMPDSH